MEKINPPKLDAEEGEPGNQVSATDLATVETQLGRAPRGIRRVAHRCPCGRPDVVETNPRLDDGTPFPTVFYVTCPRLASALGTLEADGVMREMTQRLTEDPETAAKYQTAHEDYLTKREALGTVPEIAGISAGGMPNRVKCLHVLAGHALAAGPGVNPFGDEALEMVGPWHHKPCCEDTRASAPKRLAVIDCGTNAIRLLVSEVDPATGQQTELDRRMQVVRLGEGVDQTGKFAPQAVERTITALREYVQVCESLGARIVRFVATSAARDVANPEDLTARVEAECGAKPEILAGEEEARLSFLGATDVVQPADSPVLVVDIGGGSTEFVLGEITDANARVLQVCSVNIGCVRLTERYRPSDPPTESELAAMRADVERHLDQVAQLIPLDRVRTLVGLAGSVTTVTAQALGLSEYQRDKIHGSRHSSTDMIAACAELITMTRAERTVLGFMHPGRVDVIGAGALVWQVLLERLANVAGLSHTVTSEHDILDGLVMTTEQTEP